MNIEINKGDINEHLWLQRLVEACLHRETLRRAISLGHVPADTQELWGFEVSIVGWNPTTADAAYCVKTDERRPHSMLRYEIEYTLAEIIGIAMKETS